MNFDAIVIGSGQSGNPLTFKLADEGFKVALIERDKLGGSCVNYGCTPTKAYAASAKRMFAVEHAKELGIEVPEGSKINLKQVKKRKDVLSDSSYQSILGSIEESKNVTFFKGEAKFVGKKEIEVNGQILTAEKIFIDVGTRPAIPKEFKNYEFLTNKDILDLEEVPEHLIIVGGGYVGLEFGQIFSRFGSQVTILETSDQILSKEDLDIAKAIQEILEEEKIAIHLNVAELEITFQKERETVLSYKVDGEQKSVRGTHLLLAVGRTTNTDSLDLDKTGVEMDEEGNIKIDDKLATNVAGIYALGDCNGEGAFTHTSYNDFEIIVSHLFGDKDKFVSDRIMTYGVFVDPPLARVGITLKEAKEKNLNVLTSKLEMEKVSRAKEKGETKGFMRVVIDKDSEHILGASLLGVGCDEVVSAITTLMYTKSSYKVLMNSVQIHPTVAELLPSMMHMLRPPKNDD